MVALHCTYKNNLLNPVYDVAYLVSILGALSCAERVGNYSVLQQKRPIIQSTESQS